MKRIKSEFVIKYRCHFVPIFGVFQITGRSSTVHNQLPKVDPVTGKRKTAFITTNDPLRTNPNTSSQWVWLKHSEPVLVELVFSFGTELSRRRCPKLAAVPGRVAPAMPRPWTPSSSGSGRSWSTSPASCPRRTGQTTWLPSTLTPRVLTTARWEHHSGFKTLKVKAGFSLASVAWTTMTASYKLACSQNEEKQFYD